VGYTYSEAKEHGRNNFQFFTLDMNAQALERLTMENSLRHALEREEFVLHYQPRVDLRTRQVTGVEALVRWQHPEFGLVPPSQFIPIAEENGLIVPLGEWVLRAACLQNKHWQDSGLPPVSVAVNLSARQFRNPELVESIRVILEETGLDPHYLELEITESAAMERADDSVVKLNELKAMGVRISMDDFGTGYSSLSYLQSFPLDKIKIDRAFIANLGHSAQAATIIRAVIALGRGLDLPVVAEGVETEEQRLFLAAENCNEIQGYLVGRPKPIADYAELVGRAAAKKPRKSRFAAAS
jgi:EAL domain-containing protein (putative c-di-GMP-specific phosphodiesterase class I)